MMDEAATQHVDGGEAAPAYHPLQPVKCVAFADTKERLKNMKWCMSPRRAIKRIGVLTVGTKSDLVIVAGGPTLNETYKDIPKGMDILTCGSSHDHAIGLGIKPTWHVECDPDHDQVSYYREKSDAKYLVSSRCHKSMFKALEGRNVVLWHMWESDLGKPAYRGEPAFICGATCILAAIPIALTLGYKNFHFFGFDSSFMDEEKHHAYPCHEYSQIMKAKVGDPVNGKNFTTTATWIGQAQQFEEMQNNWGHMFKATIYGDGMIAEMQKYRSKAA